MTESPKEMNRGGSIPVEDRTAYRTWSDRQERTNVGVLVANHPVVSSMEKEVFPPHNGFVTANHRVTYRLNDVPVLVRACQLKLRPDKSEATIATTERFFGQEVGGNNSHEMITITREQFDLLKEIWS